MSPSSFCSYFDQNHCRSCEWIPFSYAEQIKRKEIILKEAIDFGIEKFELKKTVPSKELSFRNRAKMSVTGTLDQPIIGLTGETVLDQGRELLHCPIHHPKINQVLAALPEFITTFQLTPYQIQKRTGELKGLILFYSAESNEMYLRFVLRSSECIERIKKLIPHLQKQFPFLVCISANLQPIPHAILEGKEEIFLTEKNYIIHRLSPFDFKLSPKAFVQTNAEVAKQLYQTAAEWISNLNIGNMIELYCGQGAFSFFAAQAVKNISGFELNPDAVAIANETANALGFSHLQFKSADVTSLKQIGADLVLVNPPRRGLGETTHSLLEAKPQYILYSSCSVQSLSADLKKLTSHYQIKKAQIFDLFPHTEHFETLVLLQLR